MSDDEGRKALEAAKKAYADAVAGQPMVSKPGEYEDPLAIAIKAYLAALPGWRLVPVGLTPEMLEAFDAAQPQRGAGGQTIENMIRGECNPKWRAAVKAAPPPPGLEESE